jgi:hypothetical protein
MVQSRPLIPEISRVSGQCKLILKRSLPENIPLSTSISISAFVALEQMSARFHPSIDAANVEIHE